MKRIKLHKNNKSWIKEYHQGTYDEIITKLLDDVEDNLPIVEVDSSVVSSAVLNDNTVDRLESYRLTDGESYENILVRMMIIAQSLNTSIE